MIVIGGSLLAAGGAGVAGYWLSRTVWLIYLKEQVGYEKIRSKNLRSWQKQIWLVTEGGLIITTSTCYSSWGVLGVVTYMYGRHLGSRR